MEQGTCIRCGMEIARSSRYPDLCRECERSMSEEEILTHWSIRIGFADAVFAIMDSA